MIDQQAVRYGRIGLAALVVVILLIGVIVAAHGTQSAATAGAQCVASRATSAPMDHGAFVEYLAPHPQSALMSPAIDAQGNIWFGEMGGNRLGRLDPATQTITEWTPPQGQSGIMGIQVDNQGNVWYAELSANHIGRFTPSTCQFHVYPLAAVGGRAAAPNGLAIAPDGTIWFTQEGNDHVGALNPATGAITEYAVGPQDPAHPVVPYGIAVAPDGTVWFTELLGNAIDRLNPQTGAIQRLPLTNVSQPLANTIAVGADGMVWFTEMTAGILGRINPATNQIVTLAAPTTYGNPAQLYDVAVDAKGAVWLTSSGSNALFRFDPVAETWSAVPLPQAASVPFGLVFGAHGAVWFTEGALSANRIGMYQSGQ
jgi:virginiamycin B lyase